LNFGQALDHLDSLVRENLPDTARIDYKGQSRDLRTSGSSILFVFLLGLLVVFLVLAAQFENWIHPLVIMSTVPLAIAGGLLGLHLTGNTLNLYSQIGLIILVGIAAKNGILIVEFAKQLQDTGMDRVAAAVEACHLRLRPILMTSFAFILGVLPLVLAKGAGAEMRQALGTAVFFGMLGVTVFGLLFTPVFYVLIRAFVERHQPKNA
jgi:multidrug efflux pump